MTHGRLQRGRAPFPVPQQLPQETSVERPAATGRAQLNTFSLTPASCQNCRAIATARSSRSIVTRRPSCGSAYCAHASDQLKTDAVPSSGLRQLGQKRPINHGAIPPAGGYKPHIWCAGLTCAMTMELYPVKVPTSMARCAPVASTSRPISWPCSALICIRAPVGTALTVSARSFCSTWHQNTMRTW